PSDSRMISSATFRESVPCPPEPSGSCCSPSGEVVMDSIMPPSRRHFRPPTSDFRLSSIFAFRLPILKPIPGLESIPPEELRRRQHRPPRGLDLQDLHLSAAGRHPEAVL